MPQKTAKGRQERSKRRLYTPEPVCDRVVALHMKGQSNREIANVEHIDRETVGRILSQQEAVEMISRQRSRLQCMADKALTVVEQALDSDDPRVAVPVAVKIIENVLPKGPLVDRSDEQKKSPEAESRERRLGIIAQIIDGSIEMSRRFNLPLPPDQVQIQSELARRLPEPTASHEERATNNGCGDLLVRSKML
jgi:hypothetical protein